MKPESFGRWVTAMRWLLGIQFLCSGGNWFIKLLPYPNMFDDRSIPLKYKVVEYMIGTGWMFQLAKIVEVATGLSLVFNRYVPLMLVASLSVSVTTFMMDVWNWAPLTNWLAGHGSFEGAWKYLLDAAYFGGAVIAMQVFLMFSYLHVYAPMLKAVSEPRAPYIGEEGGAGRPWIRGWMVALLVVAVLLGVTSDVWLVGMVKQWAIPWSSFAIFLQPKG